jgi:Las17-binding protein actin regulator
MAFSNSLAQVSFFSIVDNLVRNSLRNFVKRDKRLGHFSQKWLTSPIGLSLVGRRKESDNIRGCEPGISPLKGRWGKIKRFRFPSPQPGDKADCVVIIPGMKKRGFIVGGRYGKGMVSCRNKTKTAWEAPAMLEMGGGSVGLQIGASAVDVVMLVMQREGMDSLLKDKFTLGGDTSVAAGAGWASGHR